MSSRSLVYLRIALSLVATGCAPDPRPQGASDGGGGNGFLDARPMSEFVDASAACPMCSEDGTSIIDCQGNSNPCPGGEACAGGQCLDACEAAQANHSSVGCDYYAIDMDAAFGPPFDACYVAFIANTSSAPAHIDVTYNGQAINLAQFAKIPVGQGMGLSYQPYDPNAGLQPGGVAILFLAYAFGLGNVACPVPAAIGTEAQLSGTGLGQAFHITTDVPVVAYQMLPYGGGAAAATGASLLLPTSAWGDNYIAVSAYDQNQPPVGLPLGPSINIVAAEDNTMVTIKPKSAIVGGGGLAAGMMAVPYTFTLMKGQHAQITQTSPLSGSPIQADKPIGVFGGDQIMSIDQCCGDHGEQMIAPVRALGSEYVAVSHRDRAGTPETHIYRIFGAVDGTQLTYEPAGLAAGTVDLGQSIEIRTNQQFVVRSQDVDHPFLMFTYMTGAGEQGQGGLGDPDFVRLVPPDQYLFHYVFFTDPTYPVTALTVVRRKQEGSFRDVELDCLGTVTGWQPVGGGGEFESTYVTLVDGNFQGQSGCNNGVHVMNSSGRFGVWVWGWGSEATNTGWVSYGYPAGEAVLPINDVEVPAVD